MLLCEDFIKVLHFFDLLEHAEILCNPVIYSFKIFCYFYYRFYIYSSYSSEETIYQIHFLTSKPKRKIIPIQTKTIKLYWIEMKKKIIFWIFTSSYLIFLYIYLLVFLVILFVISFLGYLFFFFHNYITPIFNIF